MTDQILCPDCGHDIDDHSWDGCQLEPPSACLLSAMDIARAYAEERWLDGVDVGYVLGRSHSKRDEKGDRE